jgi:hypothetical protein
MTLSNVITNKMNEIEDNYRKAAKLMRNAYEFTGNQNDAIDKVKSEFQGVDTLTLMAMWLAIDAFNTN